MAANVAARQERVSIASHFTDDFIVRKEMSEFSLCGWFTVSLGSGEAARI